MNHPKVARNLTLTLFLAQSLASAAFVATAAVNTIIGTRLSGNASLAGVPSAVNQVGVALASLGIGLAMDRLGRRWGLGLGYAAGIFGGVVCIAGMLVSSFYIFLAGLVLFGVARAAMQMSRFTAAEVHPPENRGKAISYIVLGGTVGSVLGPLLVGPAGKLAAHAGLDELVGPFGITFVVFVICTFIILGFLRPEPRKVAQEIAVLYPEKGINEGVTRSLRQILLTPTVAVAISVTVMGQVIMVMLMGITSLYMTDHAHGLDAISLVFSAHTLGMFAFSILSGRLVDRWGRAPVILTGSGVLLAACALAPLSPDLFPLSFSLFLLGLGWNFTYVGGSAMLADELSPAERAKTQGVNDLLIGLVTAVGSVVSGMIFASAGYAATGIVGAVLSLIPLGAVGWWLVGRQEASAVS
ncbi:MAG: MFS transporter [Anaerolineales bacterium]|nr:MFS transporter [Anaerolineales bacterium]